MENNIHCGACGTHFLKIEDLSSHLNTCRAAKMLLPGYLAVWGGEDGIGHPLASIITGIAKSGPLIRKYAMAVATQIDTFKRAEIHRELCISLGIGRDTFAPFESTKITTLPTAVEAESIIYDALESILQETRRTKCKNQ